MSIFIPVFAGAVGAMIVGVVWYARSVFGTKWIALHGFDVTDPVKIEQMKKDSMLALKVHMLGLLVTSYVFASLFPVIGIKTLSQALAFTGVIWIGFVAPFTFSAPFFAHRAKLLGVIDAAHQLVALLVMAGVIITLQ